MFESLILLVLLKNNSRIFFFKNFVIRQSSSKCPGLSSRTVWSVTWSPAATIRASTTKLSKLPVLAPKSYVFAFSFFFFLFLIPCKEGEMGRIIFFFRFFVFCQLLSVRVKTNRKYTCNMSRSFK